MHNRLRHFAFSYNKLILFTYPFLLKFIETDTVDIDIVFIDGYTVKKILVKTSNTNIKVKLYYSELKGELQLHDKCLMHM